MNPKFFDVKKEKQDSIINASLKVFAENGYRKASTDVIVKEAGISKGLLFHYFESKKGLYEFVYDYSVKYMLLELTQSVRKNETDFFEIQRMIELAKTRVMKNYPYMQQFISSVKYENHPDAMGVIVSEGNAIEEAYDAVYKQADMTKFYSQVDVLKVIKMIGWMSDGYIKDKFREGTPDLDEMNEEFAQYLSMMREHFYAGTGRGLSAEVSDLSVERDDTVMEIMRDNISKAPVKELTFEERLAAGKKSVYEPEAEEIEEEEAVETEIVEDEAEDAVAKTDEEATDSADIDDIDIEDAMVKLADEIIDSELETEASEETEEEESIDVYSGPVISSGYITSTVDVDKPSLASEELVELSVLDEEKLDEFEGYDLSERIIHNALLPEDQRAEELLNMGPAPVLPEINMDSLRRKESTIDEVVEEIPAYYPLKF